MGLTIEQVLSQLRIVPDIVQDGSKFKFKIVVQWRLKRFEQILNSETEFDTEEQARVAAELTKEVLLKAIATRYLSETNG